MEQRKPYQSTKKERKKDTQKNTGDGEQIWGGKVHNIGTHYKSGWLRKENQSINGQEKQKG